MIVEKIDILIILYNIFVCVNLLSVLFVKCFIIEYLSIVGIKVILDSVNYIRDIIFDVKGERKDFRVFIGFD